jgi:phosphohistidine swiveling domain-containing protein
VSFTDNGGVSVTNKDTDPADSVIGFSLNNSGGGSFVNSTVTVSMTLDASSATTNDRIRHVITASDGSETKVAYKSYVEGTATVTENDNASQDVYIGETVTIEAASDDTPITIEDSDGNAVHIQSTRPGDVINYDTSSLQDGEQYTVDFDGGDTETFTAVELGLSVDAATADVACDRLKPSEYTMSAPTRTIMAAMR